MLDEHDADGYEPEHDQYLDNGDELSRLFAGEEEDSDDMLDSVDASEGLDPDDQDIWEDDIEHWDDL